MKEQLSGLRYQVSAAEERASNAESIVTAKDKRIADLRSQIKKMEEDIGSGNALTSSGGNGLPGGIPDKGIAYTVQIGAYKEIDLMEHAGQGNFNAESEGDVNKYMIGVFVQYREAEILKTHLRQMGVKDAFVVAYKDGRRTPLNEVLNQAADESTQYDETFDE